MRQERLRPSSNLFPDFSSYLVNTKPASRGSYYIVACLEATQGIPPRTELLSPLMPGAWKPLMALGQGVPGQKQKQLAGSH